MDLNLYHPNLRSLPENFLSTRSSWWSFVYPSAERIQWHGDCQLYCREEDYQNVLDSVPCQTAMYGSDRRCSFAGQDLDDWRVQVARWLSCFDEDGNKVKEWKPKKITQTVEPTVVAGPVKRASWFKGKRG